MCVLKSHKESSVMIMFKLIIVHAVFIYFKTELK